MAFLALATLPWASAMTPFASNTALARIFAAPVDTASLALATLASAWATTPFASAAAACPMPCIVAAADSNTVLTCFALMVVSPDDPIGGRDYLSPREPAVLFGESPYR